VVNATNPGSVFAILTASVLLSMYVFSRKGEMIISEVYRSLFASTDPCMSPTRIPDTTIRLRNVRVITKTIRIVVHLFDLLISRFAKKTPTPKARLIGGFLSDTLVFIYKKDYNTIIKPLISEGLVLPVVS
jgi:hypothetical protein